MMDIVSPSCLLNLNLLKYSLKFGCLYLAVFNLNITIGFDLGVHWQRLVRGQRGCLWCKPKEEE